MNYQKFSLIGTGIGGAGGADYHEIAYKSLDFWQIFKKNF